MLKHWLPDHQHLLEPPKFKFRIIRSFQDPLTRQLAEAVRIERHGDGILNSKSEFNRCRIPRLKIDQEEWGMKVKEGEKKLEGKDLEDSLEKEAEDSLGIKTPNKRKHGDLPKGRKAKKLKFAKLEGWGEGPSTGEDDLEQEGEESDHSTFGAHRGPGVGTRSGWKSSQGGTSIRTAVPEGAQDDTLPEGWNLETGLDDGGSLVENPATSETVPEGWKGAEDNHTSYIKPEFWGRRA